MTSTELTPTMPTQRLLSGLYVPADLGETTAPLDVVDRPKPGPAPTPKPITAQPRPEPPTAIPAPVEAFRPENPTSAPAPVATSTTTSPPPPQQPKPPVVRQDPPKPPTKPSAEHFKMEKALNIGYWMSVAVGAIGQIVSFGGMISPNMPADIAWTAYLAAAMLAAFAEITMVGCGTAALKRRFNEGAWKALASIACLVCLYATALNAIHWYPVDPGMAVMFAGGSFLGFTAHFIAEHTAASDYEKALARYREAAGISQPDDTKPAGSSRPTKKRPAEPKPTGAKPSTRRTSSKTTAKPKAKGNTATKDDAVRVGIEKGATTPAALKSALIEEGYALPKSQTTVENWCRAIREKRNAQ